MGQVHIRPTALSDLGQISDYLRARASEDVAIAFVDAIHADCLRLADMPLIGTRRARAPSALKGLRFLPVSGYRNYLNFYLPRDGGIELVRVLDGRRRLGPLLRGT
jgi:toxin ParE1/3/4